MIRQFLLLFVVCGHLKLFADGGETVIQAHSVDSLLVCKSKSSMTLYSRGRAVKTYSVAIGYEPLGHKQQQGDNRTPEGLYTIHDRNPQSRYYLNLGISYPNAKDRKDAARRGVAVGGDIKIHGYSDSRGSTSERFTRYAYTWGCIGVTNADMDELYRWVQTGARILIIP